MYTIKANQIVGKKIKEVRTGLGMTQAALSDAIMESCGVHISADMIGRYERAQREIDEDTLVAIAIGLDSSLQNLQDAIDPRYGDMPETRNSISMLSANEHAILRYIATDWRGDRKALIIADGIYAALPEKYALSVIMHLLEQMTDAIINKDMSVDDIPSGLPYLEQKIGALIEKIKEDERNNGQRDKD